MLWHEVEEGSVRIRVPVHKIVSRGMQIFYNPIMEVNRTLSVSVLRALGRKCLTLADPLAGTGIRMLRCMKELPAGSVERVLVNDANPLFPSRFRSAARRNGIALERCMVSCADANLFLLSIKGADYIDVDPFGSPNPFLDSACKRLGRGGILAVTATDTAPLAGTYPAACRRKYYAAPLRDSCMHERGLRILIKKVQLIGAQYDKALSPLFSYYSEHYYRSFLLCEKSKSAVDRILDLHRMWKESGPLWTGRLWDLDFCGKMVAGGRAGALLKIIKEEAEIECVGFFDIHARCKALRCAVPKTKCVLAALQERDHAATITHFCSTGIRTTASEGEFYAAIKAAVTTH